MHKSSKSRGFTLIELMIVVAVIVILSALAVANLWRLKPRADLAGATAELAALLHQARQTALQDGKPVAVIFYPGFSQNVGGYVSTGYVVMYEDACYDFFTKSPACGVAFTDYADPSKLKTGGQSKVIDTMTFPMNVVFAEAIEMASSKSLPAPLDKIPVDKGCTFCGTTAGAAQFDAQGRVTFYSLDGTAQTELSNVGGYSLSLGFRQSIAPIQGHRTLVIFSGSGMVQTIVRG